MSAGTVCNVYYGFLVSVLKINIQISVPIAAFIKRIFQRIFKPFFAKLGTGQTE